MPTTTSHLLPYPAGSDPADVPADIAALAEAVDAKLDNIAPGQITGATSGQLLIANASGVVTARTVTGDITVSNTGDAQIGAGAVGTAEIGNLAVTTAKIDNGAVTAAKLATNLQAATVPTGSVFQFAGSTAPTGYLLCDGAAISRSTYADLFTAIGTAYGTGNGSTTFNLPDLRGRVPVGRGSHSTVDALGKSDATSEANRRPAHNHTVTDPGHTHTVPSESANTPAGSTAYLVRQFTTSPGTFTTNSSTTGITVGSTGGTTDSPSFIVVNYIIRA